MYVQGVVGFLVYFELSAILLHVTDPFAPIENLFCAVFMGGIWDVKDSLCVSHSRTQTCSYGKDCRFAHGVDELRLPAQPRGRSHSIKSLLCEFSNTGYCKYGARPFDVFNHIQTCRSISSNITAMCVLLLDSRQPKRGKYSKNY
ncbi:hypothetical protein COOONC_18358 [Cooperia oncophora]